MPHALSADALSYGITNGSFETGDFTGWRVVDLAAPNDAFEVRPAGQPLNVSSFFRDYLTQATDGQYSASNAFSADDGSVPAVIELSQDLVVSEPLLTFDYRLTWASPFSSLDKDFRVSIQPAGGGEPLLTQLIATAPGLTFGFPTAYQSGAVNLADFVGQPVRLAFQWNILDDYPHPAAADLHNIRLRPVPEPVSLVLAAITLGGFGGRRRRDG